MPVKTNEREYRNFTLDAVRDEQNPDSKRVRGYATTFGNTYVLYSDEEYEIREQVDAHAFDDCDMSDTIMQYDHEGRVFARVSNGTLSLGVDEKGLAIEGDLGGTELGAQLYQEIAGGYTTKMSMGFKVDRSRDVWTSEELNGKTIETRTIYKIDKLFDVSAVSLPANDATSISARELTDGVIEQLRAERLEARRAETLRKLIQLKTIKE